MLLWKYPRWHALVQQGNGGGELCSLVCDGCIMVLNQALPPVRLNITTIGGLAALKWLNMLELLAEVRGPSLTLGVAGMRWSGCACATCHVGCNNSLGLCDALHPLAGATRL